jgi:hypothetical protein
MGDKCLWPSFETLRKSAAPQDDGEIGFASPAMTISSTQASSPPANPFA